VPTTEPLEILAVSGSLRAGSYNRAALRAAAELAPDGMTVTIADLNGIPIYNADEEAADGYPDSVVALREALRAADGMLIATPEYNYSVTGALKNALDWLSRGGDESPLNDKPAAILGAGGRFGTLRSQLHLREILAHNTMPLVQSPQVMIDRPSTKFADDGLGEPALTDERHRDQISRLLTALADLIKRPTD
jgi:chromate reductase